MSRMSKTKEFKAIAKANLELPDNPNIHWKAGEEYKCVYENEAYHLTSETAESHYTKEGFERLKELFDFVEVVNE